MFGLTTLFTISNLILTPFGSVEELSLAKNPWYGFTAQDPVLTVVRLQRLESKACASWIKALEDDDPGLPPPGWKAWEPYSKSELGQIEDCDKSPCDVKVDSAEGRRMGETPEKERLKTFLSLVTARLTRYEQTQERKEYEFPGKPVDPWEFFEKQGFRTSAVRPAKPSLRVRKEDFAPGRIKAVHQVLDRRFAVSPAPAGASGSREATEWIRDAYTDHYFDSWGEWTDVQCETAGSLVVITQALLVELDQLKKSDIFSSLMKGKARSTFDEGGRLYLDRRYERMRNRVDKVDAR